MSDMATLRKGLGNWDALRGEGDAAMGQGLDSSLDIPPDETLNGAEQSGTTEFLAKRMRFNPRRQEQAILEKLSGQLEKLMAQSYGDVDASVEQFFVKIKQAGDFSKLESIELERMILEIQKVIYIATDTVASLYNDAYFADRVQQDEFWAAYRADLEGITKPTQGDRNANAYSTTQDTRFYYYYCYLLWRRMSDKLGSLRDLQKTLEWFRSRSIKDKPF